uniref:Cilia- and flagella-associated protein 53 n=1 Tax=Polytomella parva TaxID=51329 RepID=A0A7S0V1K5_9CHLO|mmetsp:Transcript_28335/g.52182  ORF Transcript_28335/g.52182 Transcript_28335/m.52182 type:complete len:483 (+) Transcript_28335:182-1630(+)|eukprot:CAMPEP_0175064728 /NCGR_PEP_ID=MMETSP0052_2-20121109/15505_1 /TAXON_ID=51329 ORGANISM="Polytomella parva, Strain SAG 63-3" /NCGR_SAMPLE_ID=MMETSP0052_2 /ASSEMBLY_ACC=CAM_ASM_000194 /LENGTH=482 /DNA_ID=CAMNT_0016331133 /DNA_START=119 /DNA_END=1570 /DNA_ORIENTATION=-
MYRQKPPPDARIIKMREIEEKINRMKVANEADKFTGEKALWEERTVERMRRNVIQQRLDALKHRREMDVNVRRQRLAELLSAEDARLKQELIDSRETPEQRRQKLAERAKGLAAQREQERQALSYSLQQRAFEVNCVPLRDLNSKRTLYRTVEERDQQINIQMNQKILEEEEKKRWFALNEADRQRKEERFCMDQEKRASDRAIMVRQLDEQVVQRDALRAEEAALRQQEIADLKAVWQKMAAEQAVKDQEDRERLKRLSEELLEFNRLRQLQISDSERRERELDLKILQEALAKEASAEAMEAIERERRRNEMQVYREQLAQMMAKQAEETVERDRLIFQAQLLQEAKEDADRMARDEARRKLMAEVDQIRQLQIRNNLAKKQAVLEDKLRDREYFQQESLYAAEEAERRRLESNRNAITRRLETQTQVVARAHQRAVEEGEKAREAEQQRAAEEAYLRKINETLKNTEAPKWFGRKKFDW